MAPAPHIICTVTNDLTYDQRMIRICNSLVTNGYRVTLVGRRLPGSLPLESRPFRQVRLPCRFRKGPLFYAEYNLRLFFWLLLRRANVHCAIDLDTILPCLLVSAIRGSKRVYDAHELFCEMKEIVSRPSRYRIWKWIERLAVPRFPQGYTVCAPIAAEFERMYGVHYAVVRNLPLPRQEPALKKQEGHGQRDRLILYQGAVNEGRCFETLIPAMKEVAAPLHIYGDGNFLEQTRQLIRREGLDNRVLLQGKATPAVLQQVTPTAYAGITLFENNGLSNYYSLANRFFDYIQAGIPQLCVNYPSYRSINEIYEVAVLIDDTSAASIAAGLNLLLRDAVLYERLQRNCLEAGKVLHWAQEETVLLNFYSQLLG
ncbi:MAG TPA: glycosyltransferase [Lacibacter sp.]|nr:glycosyltransferase [Lacibacter sp.]HMO90307.1 glycosyltransferase [Lacibacter sp.]HMP88246.1 glycosyltransferase [Lacibacter sp.]